MKKSTINKLVPAIILAVLCVMGLLAISSLENAKYISMIKTTIKCVELFLFTCTTRAGLCGIELNKDKNKHISRKAIAFLIMALTCVPVFYFLDKITITACITGFLHSALIICAIIAIRKYEEPDTDDEKTERGSVE